jgi:hypothetical protein
MKTLKLALAIGVALGVSACGRSGLTTPTSIVESPATAAAAESSLPGAGRSTFTTTAKIEKIDICHRAGSTFSLLSIGENAWSAHQSHGDGVPLGPVPNSTMTFSATCVATTPASPAAIVATPATASFGDVEVGWASGPIVITVKNIGGSTASHLGGVNLSGDINEFVVQFNTCTPQTGPLAPNGTCEITIRFAPQSAGTKTATVSINAEVGGTASAILTGSGF